MALQDARAQGAHAAEDEKHRHVPGGEQRTAQQPLPGDEVVSEKLAAHCSSRNGICCEMNCSNLQDELCP